MRAKQSEKNYNRNFHAFVMQVSMKEKRLKQECNCCGIWMDGNKSELIALIEDETAAEKLTSNDMLLNLYSKMQKHSKVSLNTRMR